MNVDHHHSQAFLSTEFLFVELLDARLPHIVVSPVIGIRVQLFLVDGADVPQRMCGDGLGIVPDGTHLEIEPRVAVKDFADMRVVFLGNLGDEDRGFDPGVVAGLVEAFHIRLAGNVQQAAELGRVDAFADLSGDHHQVVHRLVIHQQFSVPVEHFATCWILGDIAQHIVVGRPFQLAVKHLEGEQLDEEKQSHSGENADDHILPADQISVGVFHKQFFTAKIRFLFEKLGYKEKRL